ncbi:MAG: efflux RND transporter periplasmic adaptor subunit [Rhodocyclaceae bacterium]
MKTLTLATLLALLLAACGDKQAAPIAADHHEEAGAKLTHFSERSELFVEFPALIAGQAATFVAHFTQLADFKPVAQGKLTVVLAGENGAEERFFADVSAVPGIFKPNVTPKTSGERELTLIVDTPSGTLTHELGPVTVHADAKAAAAAHGTHAEDSAITFTKEQQWKIDFATVEADKGLVRAAVTATGTLKGVPDGEAQIVAPAAGILRASGAFPRIGQTVKKGQVLALLTPRLGGESDQATLEAAAGKARIGLEQARRERERMEVLFKDEAVAEKRLLEARANERIAAAEAQAAGARAQGLGGGGGIALKSPIDGVIADVSVSAGAFVNEGAPIVHVADTAKLWLEARVPESEIGRLGNPSGAAFAVDGFAQPFAIEAGKNGRLVAVGGVVDAQTRTVPVVFEFANTEGKLRLGMTVKAQILSGDGNAAVRVPASAVQDESGTQVVYVQTGGESFERRIVQTGLRDGERIAIVAGIEPGQRIVSKGAYLIRLSTSKAGPAGHAH